MGVALIMAAMLVMQDAPAPLPAPNITPFAPAFFAEYRPNTALDMLERLPGFQVEESDEGRGFGKGGNVLIDGQRPTSKTDSLGDVLERIPAGSVARIDLIQGGVPGIDMQGKTMVANVIRLPGSGLQGAAILGAVIADTGKTGPSFRLEAQRQSLDGRVLDGSIAVNDREPSSETGGLRTRTTPQGGLLSTLDRRSHFIETSYEGTLAYEADLGAGRIRLNTLVSKETEQALSRETPIFPSGAVARDGGQEEETSGEAGLRYTREVARLGSVEGSLLYRLSDETQSSAFQGASFSQSARTSESIGRGVLRLRPIGRWTLDGGAETAFNTLDTRSVLIGAGGLANPAIIVEELRTEGFATARYQAGPSLNIEGGLRYETSKISTRGAAALDKRLSFPKPRLLAVWIPRDKHQFSLRAEREVSQLSFSDFSASVSLSTGAPPVSGNPNLEPDKTWIYEARYEWRFGDEGAVTASYVHRDIEDVISTVVFPIVPPLPPSPIFLPPGSTFEAADNAGPGTRSIFSLNVATPLDRLGVTGGLLKINTQWASSEFVDPITLLPRELAGAADFEWSVEFTHDLPQRDFKWGFEVFGNSPTTSYRPTQTEHRDGEPWASAFAEVRLRSNLTLRGEANNLTNAEADFERLVYDNPRDRGALRFIETRNTSDGRSYEVSLRRSF